jgi:hypothetical protein
MGSQGALRASCECTLRMTPDAQASRFKRRLPWKPSCEYTLRMMSPIKLIQFGRKVL